MSDCQSNSVPVGFSPSEKTSNHSPTTTTNDSPLNSSAASEGELTELTSTEISLDLQGLIDDADQCVGEDNLFGELDEAKKKELDHVPASYQKIPNNVNRQDYANNPIYQQHYRNSFSYLPGSVHNGVSYNSSNPSSTSSRIQVKKEPQDRLNSSYNNNSYTSNLIVSSTTPNMPYGQHHQKQQYPHHNYDQSAPLPHMNNILPAMKTFSPAKTSKKKSDRNSDEYRRRRERNNVAVRKSREKAKIRSRQTEERVKILVRENEKLQKKVELFQEEVSVLRSLFASVGVLPEQVQPELAKHLESFQQQHNAMSCL